MKLVREGLQFNRGHDPKVAMGIGKWKEGYYVEREPSEDYKKDPYLRDYKLSFDKGVNQISCEKILYTNPEKFLKNLPIVKFKYYKGINGMIGLFDDNWPKDFPFKSTFIAIVELPEGSGGSKFLINPEGYDYARYVIELIE